MVVEEVTKIKSYGKMKKQAMNGKTFKLPHIKTKPKEKHFIDRETFLKLKEKLNL